MLVFDRCEEETGLRRAIDAFQNCEKLAAHFELYNAMDVIIKKLGKITGLLVDVLLTFEENHHLPETSLSVTDAYKRFAEDYRAQLAAIMIFEAAREHGQAFREGWLCVVWSIKMMFLQGLLPESLLQIHDFSKGAVPLPRECDTSICN